MCCCPAKNSPSDSRRWRVMRGKCSSTMEANAASCRTRVGLTARLSGCGAGTEQSALDGTHLAERVLPRGRHRREGEPALALDDGDEAPESELNVLWQQRGEAALSAKQGAVMRGPSLAEARVVHRERVEHRRERVKERRWVGRLGARRRVRAVGPRRRVGEPPVEDVLRDAAEGCNGGDLEAVFLMAERAQRLKVARRLRVAQALGAEQSRPDIAAPAHRYARHRPRTLVLLDLPVHLPREPVGSRALARAHPCQSAEGTRSVRLLSALRGCGTRFAKLVNLRGQYPRSEENVSY
eukprot:1010736-Prymnesium_polylepis.2